MLRNLCYNVSLLPSGIMIHFYYHPEDSIRFPVE
jgi:hypothetical protein